MRTWTVPLLAAAVAAGLWAQTPNQPLTNGDIESMLSAGLPENTILLKIQQAAYFGRVNLDASAAALGGLKQKGAGERILNTVIWAEPFGAVWKQRQAEQQAVPDLPGPAGVYFKTPSGWTSAGSFLLWTPFYTGWSWMHGGREYSVPVGSGAPALQISEARPTFYIRAAASEGPWRIVRMSSRKDQRVLRLVSTGDIREVDRIPADQVRPVEVANVAGDIFTLRPAAELDAGEYVLCTAVPGGPGLNLCYAFAVRR